MNPLRLLTKGRTIRGLKERPGAYKLLEKSARPNFSDPKRPVPTTPHVEAASPQSALFEQPQAKPELQPPVSAGPAPSLAPVPVTLPVASPALKIRPSKADLWSRLTGIATGWARQWIPWRKPLPIGSATVQTELALEKVRVMRNDLSDDDLEVVTKDKRTVKQTEKPAPTKEVESEKLTANP